VADELGNPAIWNRIAFALLATFRLLAGAPTQALSPDPSVLGQTQPVPMFKVSALAGSCPVV
jgi:hypothetical protein